MIFALWLRVSYPLYFLKTNDFSFTFPLHFHWTDCVLFTGLPKKLLENETTMVDCSVQVSALYLYKISAGKEKE